MGLHPQVRNKKGACGLRDAEGERNMSVGVHVNATTQ
jgi:hypothetical protein